MMVYIYIYIYWYTITIWCNSFISSTNIPYSATKIHYIVYNIVGLCSLQYTVYILSYIVYSRYYISEYIIKCAMYAVHCTSYTAHTPAMYAVQSWYQYTI